MKQKCNMPEAERERALRLFSGELTEGQENEIRRLFPQYLFFQNVIPDDGWEPAERPVRLCTCTACGETFQAVRGNWAKGKLHHEKCNCPQAVAYEKDELAIAEAVQAERERLERERDSAIEEAASAAADAERLKAAEAEKQLREKIAALEKAAAEKEETARKAQEDAQKAQADAKSAKEAAEKAGKAGEEAEKLRGEIGRLQKQLSLAAPEVADFRAAFDRAQDEMTRLVEALNRVEDTETREKLRKAVVALLESTKGRVEE